MFHRNSRLQVVAVIRSFMMLLSAILCTSALKGQSGPTPQEGCAQYHEARVLFLLHCCGDVEKVAYPGPRFVGDLTDSRRSDLALREINTAMRVCNDRLEPAYLALQLDAAGAQLMKARSIAIENNHAWNEAGSSSGQAAGALRRFYRAHPSEAASVWKVIEHWLHESGGPWQALEFVNSLPPECCSPSELMKIRGDLLTEVGLDALAVEAYSQWIRLGGMPPTCGNESSLSNVEVLRRAGFDLPDLKGAKEAACLNAGFGYYVILPPKLVTRPNDAVMPAAH